MSSVRNLLPTPLICALTLTVATFASGLPSVSVAQSDLCVNAPPLPESRARTTRVSSIDELNDAISNLRKNSTILLEPGQYKLTRTLSIEVDNVAIRGASNNCSDVVILGPGMDEENHRGIENAFWINANNTAIANLSIGEVYYHTVQINNKSFAPHIYNVRMFNSGQQFVKANPVKFGQGVDNGIVEYSVMEYTNGPSLLNRDNSGTGYTNGVDIHAGKGWRISNNRFKNFHTPDNADHLWNAAVLVWNGASETITENNVFVNVDRAVVYGLEERTFDHRGGVIRNNMISMAPDLYTDLRTRSSDAVISILDSPRTRVLHNTVLTQGNTNLAIELRLDTSGSEVSNNITDAPIEHRQRRFFHQNDNITDARPEWFTNPVTGNLRIKSDVSHGQDKVRAHRYAQFDIDGQRRPRGLRVDIGADEATAANQ